MVVWIWVRLSYGILLLECTNLSKLGVLREGGRSVADGCRSKMILNAKFVSLRRSPRNGFSLVELVLSLAVLLVITTLAIPVVVRSLQSYQLNSTASQLAGMLKFAKFDAIRQNTKVSCQVRHSGSNWQVWVDSNGNLAPDGAEPQMIDWRSFHSAVGGICAQSGSHHRLAWSWGISAALDGGFRCQWQHNVRSARRHRYAEYLCTLHWQS